MKRIQLRFSNTLLAVLAIFISTAVYGQPPSGQQGPPPLPNDKQITKMVNDLADELSLSEEQETQISELYFAHFKEVKEMMNKNKGQRGADRREMEKSKAGFEKEVKTLLTKEQQKKFDVFQEKNQPRRGGGQRPPKG